MRTPQFNPDSEPADLIDAIWEVRRTNDVTRRTEIAELVRHADAYVRQEALSLLLTKWRDASARRLGLDALRHDPEPAVRSRAAIGLASVTSKETRVPDIALLRGIVREKGEDREVRRSCYEALCLMAGRKLPPVNSPFDVERDAEIEWIDDFA